MSIKNLFHPVDTNSTKHKDWQEHHTPIQELIGRDGMRVIGQAYDRGIIKEEEHGRTNVTSSGV